MRLFRDLSIRYKLTLLLLGVVSIVMLAVSAANVVCEVTTTRASMAAKYSKLAEIVAAQSGAALSIADVDESGAQEIISDLATDQSIRFAALYNAKGTEVVRYQTAEKDQERPSRSLELGESFTPDGYLEVVKEVKSNDGAVVGRILLRAATDELRIQIRRTILIAVVVYLAALGIALLLSFALQRLISVPILQLAKLMQQVSKEHDYSLSAEYRSHDELGALCDGFNRMLAEILRRDVELERSNGELLRSNDELRQFAYVASHDLQEPLQSITSFCNVLKVDCKTNLGADANDCVDRIVNGAARMKALVTSLLGYSRVTRDAQTPFASVDMKELMSEVLANLEGSINASKARVKWNSLPVIMGDRLQLVQLLQNLVGNAILYRGDNPPLIQIAAERRDEHWAFAVRDNGIGVAPEHHAQIFEIFKRLHRKHEYPGTGIGLAICKKIVERHGGQIWVESELNKGSAFRFTIKTPLVAANCEREDLLVGSAV